MNDALSALGALSQPMRLDVFRLLVRTGDGGLSAGDIAQALDVKPNTLSANLTVLTGAGLATATREGRSIRYRARMEGVRALLAFLLQDCCGGQPDLCQPILDEITQCGC